MENKLQGARNFGIFDRFIDESYFDDNLEDRFPHKGMSIFAKSKRIRQDLDARQRKRKIEAQQD